MLAQPASIFKSIPGRPTSTDHIPHKVNMRSALVLSLAAAAIAAPTPAEDLLPRQAEAKIIPGKYIVKLKTTAQGDVASFVGRSAASRGRAPTRTFEFGDFKGFAGYLSDEQKAELEKNPDVSIYNMV